MTEMDSSKPVETENQRPKALKACPFVVKIHASKSDFYCKKNNVSEKFSLHWTFLQHF